MDPADEPSLPILFRLAPRSQTACYLPWLKVSVALRYALTFPWIPDAWREVRVNIPWLLAEQSQRRIRRAGTEPGERRHRTMHYIAFDAHKRYTLASVEQTDG